MGNFTFMSYTISYCSSEQESLGNAR